MARKRRIEYPGATYHVISWGNYRKEFFLEHGSGASFEATLIEAVKRCGWEVYAYVIMLTVPPKGNSEANREVTTSTWRSGRRSRIWLRG